MSHLFGFAVYSRDYSLQSPVLPPMYSQNVGIRKLWNRYSESFGRNNLPFFSQDEDGEWVPLVCPICREVVTILTWTSTEAPIPQEMRNYNSLYRNNPGTRRSDPSRPMWAVSFLVYLLVFIQLTPFLSTRFTIDPKGVRRRKSFWSYEQKWETDCEANRWISVRSSYSQTKWSNINVMF